MRQTYFPPEHLLFVKLESRKLRVGDIIKKPWGLREILALEANEHWIDIKLSDAEIAPSPEYKQEVLVQ